MSKQTQSATENALSRILELTRKIVEKSGNGNCIYRGEPEHYDKVSSTLYRRSPSEYDSGKYDLERLQNEILRDARNHINEHEKEDKFELLTQLQHYGSQTNLIDFTTDYHIALFFACYGSHFKNGRIIVLLRTKDIDKKYSVKRPSKPINRVMAQKSMFTQPQKGFIDPTDFISVPVPANLKQWLLIYLRNFQDISTHSIYNDLHGFIKNKDIRFSREVWFPLVMAELQLEYIEDNNLPDEEKQAAHREAIEGCTNILQYSPYDVKIYVDQGKYYSYLNEYDCAIEVCSKAILLQPDYYDAYDARAFASFQKKDYLGAIEDFDYMIQNFPDETLPATRVIMGITALHLKDWKKAKLAFETEKKISANLFCVIYQSVADFEQKYNLKLPVEIADMLTPP